MVFVSQHPLFTEDTVLAELALYAGGPAAREVDEAALMAALASVNAAHLARRTVVDCSPGELRRVAVARALARIAADPGVELALFDEPTAHLDPASAAAVRQSLASLEGSVAVVVATHDQLLAGMLGSLHGIGSGAGHVLRPQHCRPDRAGRLPAEATAQPQLPGWNPAHRIHAAGRTRAAAAAVAPSAAPAAALTALCRRRAGLLRWPCSAPRRCLAFPAGSLCGQPSSRPCCT